MSYKVCARGTLLPYKPFKKAAQVRCPMLLWVCEDDALAPPDGAIAKVARESQNAQVKRHPGGHFDIYVNGPFERAVEDQIAFLTQTLAAQKTAAQ